MRKLIILVAVFLMAPTSLSGVKLVGGVKSIPAQVLAGGPVEAKCTQFGANCLMSEPLNTNVYQPVDVTGQAPGQERACAQYTPPGGQTVWPDIDFGDSEGSGRKEATRALIDCRANTPIATSGGPADVSLPAASSGINYVMYSNASTNITIDSHFGTGNKRICGRQYLKFSTDYVYSNVCAADKLMETWQVAGTSIQMVEWENNHDFQMWAGPWTNPISNSWFSPRMSATLCVSNWCRLEMCISTTDSDVRNGTNITVEGYVTQVGVASPESRYQSNFLGNSNFCDPTCHTSSLAEFWTYVTYRNDIQGQCRGDVSSYGHRYESLLMTAGWTTNSGQTIGCASEMEGAGC